MENNYNNYNSPNGEYNTEDNGGYGNAQNEKYNPYQTYQGDMQRNQQTDSQQSAYQQNGYQQSAYQNTAKEPPKKKGAFAGFGVTLIKAVSIALVFGLVSAAAASAVFKVSDVSFGIFENQEDGSDEKDKENDDDKEVNKNDDTESAEDEKAEVKDPLEQTNTNVNIGTVMDVSDIVENAMPCVVAISNTGQITYHVSGDRLIHRKARVLAQVLL